MKKELQDAIKIAKREYHRKWRRDNPEKVKAYQERYWKKKAEQLLKKDA